MAVNYDGRVEIRLFYVTTISSVALPHRHSVDVDYGGSDPSLIPPGVDFSDVPLIQRNGIETDAATFLVAYMDVLVPLWRPTTEFSHAELWVYGGEPSQDATFKGAYSLGMVGTAGAGADQPAQQLTLTSRSEFGGILRTQLMEVSLEGSSVQTEPFTPSTLQNLAVFLDALTTSIVARDNGHIITPIKAGLGQNEKLWRKRFRGL